MEVVLLLDIHRILRLLMAAVIAVAMAPLVVLMAGEGMLLAAALAMQIVLS